MTERNNKRWLTSGALIALVLFTVAYSRIGSWTVVSTMHGETNYLGIVLGNHADSVYRKISPSNLVDVLETHTWNFSTLNASTLNIGTLVVTNPATPSVIARDGSSIEVSNTATETVIFTNLLSAAVMGTNRAIRCRIFADFLVNNLAATNFTIAVRFGGVTNVTDATKAWTASTTWRNFEFDGTIANLNSASSQWWHGRFSSGGQNNSAHGGIGDFASTEANAQYAVVANSSAVDTTAAVGFSVSITWQGAGTNSFRKKWATLYLE